jgi:hypothetical protein
LVQIIYSISNFTVIEGFVGMSTYVKLVVILWYGVLISACGGGGSDSDSECVEVFAGDCFSSARHEFVENAAGNITEFSFFNAFGFGSDSSFITQETTNVVFQFDKPLVRSGNRLITTEPRTTVSLVKDPAIVESGGAYQTIGIFIYNDGAEYTGQEFDYMGGNALEANYTVPTNFFPNVSAIETNDGVVHDYNFWNWAIGSDLGHIDKLMIIESGVVFEPWRVKILHQHNDDDPDTFSSKVVFNHLTSFPTAE